MMKFLSASICTDAIIPYDLFDLRYDVAKLANMDYKDPIQKKLVDKICTKLEQDDDWDEEDDFEKAYKEMGLKRYKLDKKLLSVDANKETYKESLASSSSKECKSAPKALGSGELLQIKLQNPLHLEMITTSKTTKSAATAVSNLLNTVKGLLPSIITSSADQGFFFIHCCLFLLTCVCLICL